VSARGKEVYIITGVLVVVVCVAWFFLLYNPLRKDISALGTQIDEAQQQITTAQADLSRLKSYEKTSPQTRADLLRLNKMLPSQTGIPSIIIEITRTAEESGLEFSSIEPGQILPGQPFSVQPINLSFAGQYFDLEAFLVTGRLLQVASIAITRGTDAESSGLQITMTINCYLWSSQQASTANTTQPAPLPSASPSPTASPSPGLSPGATESPSPGASPFATPSGSPAASPASPSPSPSEVSP
jgi:Tfp pilus assembly protein PilO